jgi:hypothetical protein
LNRTHFAGQRRPHVHPEDGCRAERPCNVPEVTWEDVASRGEKVMKEIGEREPRRLALPHILAVA